MPGAERERHAHTHRHAHDDGGALLSAASVRRRLYGVVAAAAMLTALGALIWWPRGEAPIERAALDQGERADATVLSTASATCSFDPTQRCGTVVARLDSGERRGANAELEYSSETSPAASLRPNDRIILHDAGTDVPLPARYAFADYQRRTAMAWLLGLFAVVVVALGRWRGLLALVGLVASVAVLLGFVLPALLRGSSPIGVALTGASMVALVALYVAHGVNDRTTVALIGTFASLAITAVLGAIFASAAHFTGLADEEAINLLAFAPDLDFRGLLLAAVIIGSLGVLDDVTVTQVSAVSELHAADPALDARRLYAAGVRIGRDHVASAVNTLVLAYAAAALPLLLLLTQSGRTFWSVVTSETMAAEIVQTLVGSIGLVASVPITTALATYVATRSESSS